mmetsp:Transcript_2725/g.7031  ORF Transcript_2725/g.7031 Transcript_2725/m.7031 type:complete len:1002 (+) Transcript_2725:160-3165(+)
MPPSHGNEGHGGHSESQSLGENTVVQAWAVVFAAVCLSFLVECWRRRATGQNAGTRLQSIGFQLWLRIRYVLSYPVPPRSMWAWGAGSAVSVLDLLVMGAWAAMAYTCLYYKVQARLSPAASPDRQMKVYAKAMGTATRAQLALALLPVPRSNFLAWLLPEAEFSVLIKYHRWMSWGLLYTYCLHGAGYAYVWLGGAGILVALGNTVNLWGVIALVLGLTISLTSCAYVRRSNYQLFYRIHVIGAPLFLLALFIHDRMSALYVVPAMLLVVVDRVHRIWADLVNRTSLSVAQGSLAVEGGIITIKLPWDKSASLHGTETLYLTVPALSSNPHPFSVADVIPAPQTNSELPHSEEVCGHTGLEGTSGPGQIATIHAKVSGCWTAGLRTHALLKPNEPLLMKVEGPYESSLRVLPHSPVVVMVAGGIGVTPLLALLRRWNREYAQAAAAAAATQGSLPGKPHPCTSQHHQLAHQHKNCQLQLQGLKQGGLCPLSSQDGIPADAHNTTEAHQGSGSCERDVESLCCDGNAGGDAPQGNASFGTDSGGTASGSSGSSSRSDGCWGSGGDHDATGLCSSAAPSSPSHSSGGHAAGTPPPSQVYLVFSCKSLDELRLLGPELLDAAYGSGANKWLHLYVSYTGFELEAAGKTCAMCTEQGQECILRPSLLLPKQPSASKPGSTALEAAKACKCNRSLPPSLALGSPCSRCSCTADGMGPCRAQSSVARGTPSAAEQGAGGCGRSETAASNEQLRRPIGSAGAAGTAWLQRPPSRQLCLYLACACLAFAGAYLSQMQLAPSVLGYLAGGDWYGPVESGTVLFVLAVSGAAVPPALLLYIHHTLGRLCRWLRCLPRKPNRSVQEPQLLLQCCVHSNDANAQRPRQDAADGTHQTGLRVLPGYELDWDSKPEGKRVKVCRGRPQLTQLLRAIQQLHGNASKARSGLSSSGGSDDSSGNEPLITPVPRCGLIPVLIGGPEPMWISTQEACWQLNGMRAPAFLEPHRVAHQH